MKRILCLFVLLLSMSHVFAVAVDIPLSDMTVDELEALIIAIEDEIAIRKSSHDPALSWAMAVSRAYQSSCAEISSVKRINSEVLGQDICFIVDLKCKHSSSNSRLVHLNDVLIPICQTMSTQKSIDSVSFTIFNNSVDKYGNEKRSIAITASYRMDTLKKINYSHFKNDVFSKPKAFIECADSYYISPDFNTK